ncbi:MAG TPA: class I SAM-dependent DNA methyltransferase [Candidatus Saccharicenans sp.]|nr:class I SAM-dependent DNA methyltransferase [Candidatus Saccharicenans sp.]HPP24362.1 class I SAM-dependent DNA methyltransferase [Candidatus Saccharicenans sp.]
MIPAWLEKRHKFLWDAFHDSPFHFEDAAKILKEKMQDSENQINVFLSELRKRGWLGVEPDKDDARKKIYKLISKEEIISETLAISKNELTRADLDSLLKAAADLIRTRVDYTFILLLLFYKRISDKWETEFDKAYKDALADGLTESEARLEAKNSIYHDFDISQDLLWENIRKDPAYLPENFSRAMKALSELNPELKDVFENVDFVQFTSNRENAEILRQLVELFSARSLHHVAPDILGDAYEWILKYFAPQKAKEGEIYTPREVIRLLVEILDPKPGDSVYDPAYGSGGMLITAYQHVENEYGKEALNRLFLFGQEVNYKTLALSKMNLYIHDIRNAQVAQGDSLLYPKFKDKEGLKKFNVVIANPPWNQDGYDEETLKKSEFWKERFEYGFTPRQSADWAWIQHMLASADGKDGRVGVVIDNGCLFRGGKEKAIRSAVVSADRIEAVILLPEKLFYNTGAPGAILILNKNKPADRKEKVLFINASQEYQQHPDVRKLNQLADSNIDKIVKAYREFKEIDGFSRIVGYDELKDNDFNLNVTLYVFPEEEVENIDVLKEWVELRHLEKEILETEAKIENYLKEIYQEE